MRNNLRNIIGIVAIFLAFFANPDRAHAQQRDLMELYRLAKAKDPVLARADARLESGRADKEIALAALLPRINANGSVRQFWHRVVDFAPAPIDGEFTGYSYSLGGEVPLFSMPSYYQISSADAGIKSAESGVQATRQDLIVRVTDAYIKLLKATADERLFRDELARVGKIVEQAQAFLAAGTGDIIAVYEAKARFDSASADLVKTEGMIRLAQQNLASLSGVTVEAIKEITVTEPQGAQPAELEWWLDTMRQRNPALIQAREDLLQSEESRKAAKAEHYPTLQGNGGYKVDKGSTFLPKVETTQWYAGIQLEVPIYSGGETSARTRRALAGELERRAMLDDAQEQAIKRLKEAYLNLQYNVSLVDAYRRKHDSAEMQLKAVQKGRSIGTRTSIDLINAEQTYATSRRDMEAALFDNLQRRLELKSAAGILSEDDFVTVNGLTVQPEKMRVNSIPPAPPG